MIRRLLFLKTDYFNFVKRQVAYLQHQSDREYREYMVFTAFCSPGDMSWRSQVKKVAVAMISKHLVKLSFRINNNAL